MLQALLEQMAAAWPFSEELEMECSFLRDGELAWSTKDTNISLSDLLESCASNWAPFEDEAKLKSKALKAKLRAEICSFATAVLLVRSTTTRCRPSLTCAFPERRVPCAAARSLSGVFPARRVP